MHIFEKFTSSSFSQKEKVEEEEEEEEEETGNHNRTSLAPGMLKTAVSSLFWAVLDLPVCKRVYTCARACVHACVCLFKFVCVCACIYFSSVYLCGCA